MRPQRTKRLSAKANKPEAFVDPADGRADKPVGTAQGALGLAHRLQEAYEQAAKVRDRISELESDS